MKHCPNCGAENEVEAQFCGECGTPLDLGDSSTPDDDQTLLSTNVNDLVEAQKTEIFKQNDSESPFEPDQEEIVESIATEASSSDPFPVVTIDSAADLPPLPPSFPAPPSANLPPSPSDSSGGSSSFMNQRNLIIIGVIVLVLLCCCCCSPLLLGALFPDEIEDAIREISYLAIYLPLG